MCPPKERGGRERGRDCEKNKIEERIVKKGKERIEKRKEKRKKKKPQSKKQHHSWDYLGEKKRGNRVLKPFFFFPTLISKFWHGWIF